jgi:hypothetical protein
MPLIVPSSVRRGQSSGANSATAPQRNSSPALNPVFLLTAASQMHSEGRLIADDQSGTDAKLNSIPTDSQSPVRT